MFLDVQGGGKRRRDGSFHVLRENTEVLPITFQITKMTFSLLLGEALMATQKMLILRGNSAGPGSYPDENGGPPWF